MSLLNLIYKEKLDGHGKTENMDILVETDKYRAVNWHIKLIYRPYLILCKLFVLCNLHKIKYGR